MNFHKFIRRDKHATGGLYSSWRPRDLSPL